MTTSRVGDSTLNSSGTPPVPRPPAPPSRTAHGQNRTALPSPGPVNPDHGRRPPFPPTPSAPARRRIGERVRAETRRVRRSPPDPDCACFCHGARGLFLLFVGPLRLQRRRGHLPDHGLGREYGSCAAAARLTVRHD